MRDQSPVISVVMALLNNRPTLERALDSVLGQDYAERELIVMDGGSTDGGVDVLRHHAASIAYWESEPDRGRYHAFNKAVAKARGDWIYILGADDYLWDARVFSRMAPHLAGAYPPARVAYAQANFVSARGEVLELIGEPWDRSRFVQGFMIPHQAVFHHRSLFEVHGSFNESFQNTGDYEMLLRELKGSDALFVPGIIVAGYQFGGGSTEAKNTLQILQERRRAWKLNGVAFPGLRWRVAEARAVLRICLWTLLGERLAKRLLDLGRALLGKPAFWTRI